ncbi:MAG TPA: hypothetical protein VFZ34_13245 [Blastocatellia bacterium]|nr:hypothetical protein [Blastocatellia bacterium]
MANVHKKSASEGSGAAAPRRMLAEEAQEFVIPASVNIPEVLKAAREAFYQDENVIGVGIGQRRVKQQVQTEETALLVYVQKKLLESAMNPAYLIPKTFRGLRTDVVEVFHAGMPHEAVDYMKDHHHIDDMRFIDWARVHQLLAPQAEAPIVQHAVNVQDFGDVCVIQDPGNLVITINGQQQVDFVAAYQLFRTRHGDDYDHVTFFLDTVSGMPTQCACSFFSWIYNDVQGIGLGNINNRAAWGTSRLQGFHFMNQGHFPLWRYVMGQEWAHQFAAFARYRDPATNATMNDHLLGGWAHWALNFDDDRSPMDYDDTDWVELPNGNFRRVSRTSDERAYCALDLYLMGLLGPSEVGEIYHLRNVTPVSGSTTDFTATPVRLNVQNFIAQEGPRVPSVAVAPKFWRQAFIVLTKDIHKVHDLVETVDFLRLRWETDFYQMTKGLGRVDTVLDARPGRLTPAQIAELTGGGYTTLHRHRVGANDLQIVGTQWTATINPGETQNWFTFNWSPDWFINWSIRPTTPGGKLKWEVSIERAANNTFTYWVLVTNTGTVATSFEGKYSLLK